MLPSLQGLSVQPKRHTYLRKQNNHLIDDANLASHTIDMKRSSAGRQQPPGIRDDEWERYLCADRNQPGNAKCPRSAYRNWTDKDVKECRKRNTLHSAPGKLDRLVPYTAPPNIDLFAAKDALWLLNVKPPWATALVHGVKNVENRTWGFSGERWTLIVASAKQTKEYSDKANADMNTRLVQSGQQAWIGKFPVNEYQHIVGIVKLRALEFEEFSYEEELCSVWYNGMNNEEDGADTALYVEEAFAFENPIPYTEGTLSMTRFAMIAIKHPSLVDVVKRELARLGFPSGSSAAPSTQPSTQPSTKPSTKPSATQFTKALDSDEDEGSESVQELALPLPDLPTIPSLPASVTMSHPISSLNEWGCMAWPVEYAHASITNFVDQVNAGAHEWMAAHLARALVEPPRKDEFASGHQIWQMTDPSIRQTILNYFDLRTREGAIRLFDPKLRKASIPEPVRAYLNERLEYAKAGMNATAQGNSHKAWTLTGFGIWTRIWTSLGINMLLDVQTMLTSVGFDTHISGVPHIIYKPPRGANLPAHHDQMPTTTLIENLRDHVKSDDPSVEAWTKKHGMQLLAHIRGGYDDGYTYTVGPLDCKKLLFCLKLLLKNPSDIAEAAWSNAKAAANKHESFFKAQEGPYFVDWYKLVGKDGNGPLNAHLIQRGFTPLRIVPIRPFTNNAEPYLAMWPVGFPHGSMSNQEPRVTLTMNLTLKAVNLEPRVIERLKNVAILAHTGSSDAEVAAAEAAFQADTKPYHDGGTHKMPEMMADLQRNAAYASGGKPVGPFASLAPTRQDVTKFVAALPPVAPVGA